MKELISYCCLKIMLLLNCSPFPASIQTHHFSNQLSVTLERTTVIRVFMVYINKELYHRIFVEKNKTKHLTCRMLCENNGTLDEHEYNLKCLAVRAASYSWRKVLALLRALSPTPHPHQSSLSRSHFSWFMTVSIFKGACLRPVSHLCGDGLFQGFHTHWFGLVGPSAALSPSAVRLWSLIMPHASDWR